MSAVYTMTADNEQNADLARKMVLDRAANMILDLPVDLRM